MSSLYCALNELYVLTRLKGFKAEMSRKTEVIAPFRWQSFFPKKEAFEVCKFHGATYVRPGHPSVRTQALCFIFALRTRRKQQPFPPMARVLNTKIASLMLQYVNLGIRLHTPA